MRTMASTFLFLSIFVPVVGALVHMRTRHRRIHDTLGAGA